MPAHVKELNGAEDTETDDGAILEHQVRGWCGAVTRAAGLNAVTVGPRCHWRPDDTLECSHPSTATTYERSIHWSIGHSPVCVCGRFTRTEPCWPIVSSA